MRVRDLLSLAHRKTVEGLAAELGPAVLVGAAPVTMAPAEEDLEDTAGEWSYATRYATLPPPGEGEDPGFRDHLVFPIRKAKPGPFANTILIGRAPSNDVVLVTEGISKLHARIKIDGEELSISDADSTNGTFINGKRLESGESVVLQQGDEILFGERAFKLHRIARFHSMLKMLPRVG